MILDFYLTPMANVIHINNWRSVSASLSIYTHTYLGVYKCLDWCIIKTPYRKTRRYFKLVGV